MAYTSQDFPSMSVISHEKLTNLNNGLVDACKDIEDIKALVGEANTLAESILGEAES